ncbi:FMN-binding negative transcriptional regulator [Roseateles paludis]|jgi:transcriptional regulator|uniref:FMN-binding negative transcriptional regulator n=1 Tax=Roseateles paludis TaxID=3145238 RepID=A0ABV0G315_9BURK
MYLPRHFEQADLSHVLDLIASHPLALLIGVDAEGSPLANPMPMVAQRDGDALVLEGHWARANPQAQALLQRDGGELLAAFSGPDCYVSPRHYDHERNVPTWNYLAVHCWGRVEVLDEPASKDALLKRLIGKMEPSYAPQWRGLPEDYQQKLLGAIVGLRLHVTRWQAKFKLSQNRAASERSRMVEALGEGDAGARGVAEWMRKLGL